jgi:hypothetical protein
VPTPAMESASRLMSKGFINASLSAPMGERRGPS